MKEGRKGRKEGGKEGGKEGKEGGKEGGRECTPYRLNFLVYVWFQNKNKSSKWFTNCRLTVATSSEEEEKTSRMRVLVCSWVVLGKLSLPVRGISRAKCIVSPVRPMLPCCGV